MNKEMKTTKTPKKKLNPNGCNKQSKARRTKNKQERSRVPVQEKKEKKGEKRSKSVRKWALVVQVYTTSMKIHKGSYGD